MTGFVEPTEYTDWDGWHSTSNDPSDETFGDVVEPTVLADADGHDAVLVGEPYDDAVIGRRGASEGPAALRTALAGTKTHHFDVGPLRAVGDLGNLDVPEGSVSEVQDTLSGITHAIHEIDTLPVFLGGDNSLSYPNAVPLLDRGSLGIVNFDAHLDCREVRGEPTSGTPHRQLHEAGLDAYAVVGARHFETSTEYHEFVRDQGGTIVTAEEVGANLAAALGRVRDTIAGVEQLYVSVDLDVLDATAAPGVSAPTPGGLSSRELFGSVRRIVADSRIAGFEVVECAPPLDTGGRTATAGARAIAHVLAGVGA